MDNKAHRKPELLLPAGNLERLKIACLYGADAVYIGGQKYGLRARADNFTLSEIEKAIRFAHRLGKKVYVVLNAFLHDEDFEGLADYAACLKDLEVDAVIVSDLGVMSEIRRAADLRIHLSTQASCLNARAASVWRQLGASRIVLGREVSIEDAGKIAKSAGVEVELFVHGAMCMAYSGHCTISNFTAGRDSNRGGCIQSCRFDYTQNSGNRLQAFGVDNFLRDGSETASSSKLSQNNSKQVNSTFMSSKDLNGSFLVPGFLKHGISSLKVEGRMKSALYVATTARVYRRLLDACSEDSIDSELLDWASSELEAIPHRDYCRGSLDGPAAEDSVYLPKGKAANSSTQKYQGLVLDKVADKLLVKLVEPLSVGSRIEFLMDTECGEESPTMRTFVKRLESVDGEILKVARQESVVLLDVGCETKKLHALNLIRCNNVPENRV